MNMALSTPVEQTDITVDSLRQWVAFRLGEQDYGVPVDIVQEVLRVNEIAPVPGAPSYLLGVMNIRGNIVSVVNGRKRFGMPSVEHEDQNRILVLRLENGTCGMLVDRVTDVVEFDHSEIQPLAAVEMQAQGSPIKGVVYRDDGFVVLVDTDKLILEA